MGEKGDIVISKGDVGKFGGGGHCGADTEITLQQV
jgi:hypothetical protein